MVGTERGSESSENADVIASIVLAGGVGRRLGGPGPKQLELLGGKPLFVHALRAYAEIPEVERLVLVAHESILEAVGRELRAACLHDSVEVVTGGATRQESLLAGLTHLERASALAPQDVLILQNAASPCTSPALIRSCLNALQEADVVQAYRPAIHTTFEVLDGHIGSVYPRASLGTSCDPTIYRAAILQEVLRHEQEGGLQGESTIDVVRSLGHPVRLVESPARNIKVTVPAELAAVRYFSGETHF